ncbi:MAG: protein-glutamate O-methyltransferase CheR [Planctomycetales bacterium]|nr:protein-glutamate O-methyltransferase CheR [Planctomycetales bacterium]
MPLAEADIDFLRGIVADGSGHVISRDQGYLFETRLQSLAQREGHETVDQLVSDLRQQGRKRIGEEVAEAMTINETFFFRDMHPFEALKQTILPTLIEARKQRKLTIWCAACSTGQEPYSIAIMAREHFPELRSWDVKIVATDLSDGVLQKARTGKYTQFEVNRGLPAQLLVKHFVREGTEWKVNDDIRRLVEFRKLNLTAAWPALPCFDVVFLRNVLIYFSVPTKEQILSRLHRSMADDAYLMLGGGETLINLKTPFQRETYGSAVCYRPLK